RLSRKLVLLKRRLKRVLRNRVAYYSGSACPVIVIENDASRYAARHAGECNVAPPRGVSVLLLFWRGIGTGLIRVLTGRRIRPLILNREDRPSGGNRLDRARELDVFTICQSIVSAAGYNR